jgi:hypothetical protein
LTPRELTDFYWLDFPEFPEKFPSYGCYSITKYCIATRSALDLHISFTLRDGGTLIRVISARDMSRKKKDRYAQEA